MTTLLTVPEAAASLGVSRRTLYRIVAEGDLPVVMVRGRIRLTPAALSKYEKSLTVPAFRRAN